MSRDDEGAEADVNSGQLPCGCWASQLITTLLLLNEYGSFQLIANQDGNEITNSFVSSGNLPRPCMLYSCNHLLSGLTLQTSVPNPSSQSYCEMEALK